MLESKCRIIRSICCQSWFSKKKKSLDAAIILQTKGQAFEMQLAAFLSKMLFQLLFDDD